MFTSSIKYNITLSNPPNNFKYSPANNKVSGTINIEFKDTVKFIKSINYSLVGTAEITYFSTHLIKNKNVPDSLKPHKSLISQNFPFYVKTKKADLDKYLQFQFNPKTKTYSYYTDQKLKIQFEHEFPNDMFLPSSCSKIGNKNKGEFSIYYDIKVEIIQKKSGFLSTEKVLSKCKIPLIYQSRLDYNIETNIKDKHDYSIFSKSDLFQEKEKAFYYSSENKSLIPVSKRKNSIFSKSSSKSNGYESPTRSVPLSIEVETKPEHDMSKSFIEQFNLKLVSDLKNFDTNNNKSKEFQFNDQSTKLGLFKILSLTLEVRNKITIQYDDLIVKDTIYTPIMNIPFKELFFDIKDFQYDKEKKFYFMNIDNDKLLKHCEINLKTSLLDLLYSKTILTTGFTPAWFGNIASLTFNWSICDANNESTVINYNINTLSTFNFPLDYKSKRAELKEEIVEKEKLERKLSNSSTKSWETISSLNKTSKNKPKTKNKTKTTTTTTTSTANTTTTTNTTTTNINNFTTNLSNKELQNIQPFIEQITKTVTPGKNPINNEEVEEAKKQIFNKIDDLFKMINNPSQYNENVTYQNNPNTERYSPEMETHVGDETEEVMLPPPSYEESETQYLQFINK